jgi:hypothetical protein
MAVLVVLLSIVLMYAIAYTAAVERTIHALGLVGGREAGSGPEARARMWIALRLYLVRLNPTFLLAMGVYLATARGSAWYYGVLLLGLCGLGSVLIATSTWLHCGSPEVVALLMADLQRQRDAYRSTGNAVRLQAVEDLLARMQSRPRAQV